MPVVNTFDNVFAVIGDDFRSDKCAVSTTFRRGMPLVLSSNLLAPAVSDGSADSAAVSAGVTIVGYAMEDGVTDGNGNFTSQLGLTKNTLRYAVNSDRNTFRVRAYAATATNSEVQDIVRGFIGNVQRINRATTSGGLVPGVYYGISLASPTNAELTIVGVQEGQGATDIYAVVWVRGVVAYRGV